MARDKGLVALKEHLTLAQNRMKKFYDMKWRAVEFEVGIEVFLKLRPYRQWTLAKKHCEKLSLRFYGPYPVLERIGEVASTFFKFHMRQPFTMFSMFPNWRRRWGRGRRSKYTPLNFRKNLSCRSDQKIYSASDGTWNWVERNGWSHGRSCQKVKWLGKRLLSSSINFQNYTLRTRCI